MRFDYTQKEAAYRFLLPEEHQGDLDSQQGCLCKVHTATVALQAIGYYCGMLAYYWVLATPAVGFLFGCYLYVAVNMFHVHYDEAFSALRIPHYKGFSRLHLTQEGDLVIYALAMDQASCISRGLGQPAVPLRYAQLLTRSNRVQVPNEWQEDRRWRQPGGGGARSAPSHKSRVPSRWIPVASALQQPDPDRVNSEGTDVRVVDRLVVPKRRQF